jgi:hypothetical protein
MYAWVLVVLVYLSALFKRYNATLLFSSNQQQTGMDDDDDSVLSSVIPHVFEFGTNDPLQVVLNHLLLEGSYRVPYRVVFLETGIAHYYVNGSYQRMLRKPFRFAKRCKKLVVDQLALEPALTCRVCSESKTCIMLRPCGHVGLCNRCCFRIFNKAFFVNTHTNQMFQYEPTSDPRMSHGDTLDDILNDIRASQNRCPFCKSSVTHFRYAYIV